MISYLHIPTQALINTPISKRLFAEKAPISAAEKRILREDIESITMKGLFQTRTVGLQIYNDDEYLYDQIIIAEVEIRSVAKAIAIAGMIQRAFPVPMFLILHSGDKYCVNWCVKRINQADRTKRVIEDQQLTRFFVIDSDDAIIGDWLLSLDVTRLHCITLKDLFDELSCKLTILTVSDELGVFVDSDTHKIEIYRLMLEKLEINREEQKKISAAIKGETQFNARLKLTSKLKALQLEETEIKGNNEIRYGSS